LQRKDGAEREAHQRTAADAQQVAPRDAEVGIAEVAAGLSRDSDHGNGIVEVAEEKP
jgi:hypothetical protein